MGSQLEFRGKYEKDIVDNILYLPRRFKDTLENRGFISNNNSKLTIMTEKEPYKSIIFHDLEKHNFIRAINVLEIPASSFDSEGRIYLPNHLIEFLGSEQKLVLTGGLDHFRLWNPEHYKRYLDDVANGKYNEYNIFVR